MAIYTIDDSQRKAARVAGLAYLIAFATVVYVNFGIHERLVVENSAETARNILAHEPLFRIGIVGDLAYCAGVVVLLTALYVILKPVSRGLALLAEFWRLVWVLMLLVMTLNLFDTLRLLRGADTLQAFEAERLQALARLYLGTRFDYYYRALAAFGVISSAFCVACTLVFYIFPNFDKIVNLRWFDTPMGLFDIIAAFWLLF